MQRDLWLSMFTFAVVGCVPHSAKPADGFDWAVGSTMGMGSVLFGPSECTFDAPPEVAKLSRNQKGAAFMAELVGPGKVFEQCSTTRFVHTVLVPIALRIDGPDEVKIGAAETLDSSFRAVPLADAKGKRTLLGIHQRGTNVSWSLGADCEGVATFATVLGASDTGGQDVFRSLRPVKPGTCTITANALGLTMSKRVTIK